MKKFRTILCLLLAVCMIFALCACGKSEDSGSKEDAKTPDTSSSADSGKKDEAPAKEDKQGDLSETNSATVGDVEPEVIQDTIIMNRAQYEARPHEIQPGTVLNYVLPNDVPSQVPWNDSAEGFVYYNMYEGLLYSYLGNVEDIRGAVAETWEHTDDYLDWTFHIREGVKFHDGTVCDANAIEKCWNYHYDLVSTNITNYNIESWDAVDDMTFHVHLSAPCAYFENAMCGNALALISPTACEKYGTDNNGCAVGTGPYYIEDYISGVKLVFKAFPDYYLEEKSPCIETVNYMVLKDQNTLVMALMNGEVDGANITSIENYYNLIDSGYDGDLFAAMGNVGPMYMNAKAYEPFCNYEVREAFARFVDYNAINDLLYDGLGIVQDSLWAKDTSGYVPTDDYYYDPDEGHELLSSIGMQASDLSFSCTSVEGSSSMEAIQGQLQKAGVNMEIEIIEAAANFTYLMNGDWTVTVGSNAYTNSSPYVPWTYILPQNAIIKQCWQDVYDPELYETMLDEYAKMNSSATWEEMIEHCHQITTYMQDDHGALLGIQRPGFVALNKKFKNAIYYTLSQDIMFYYLYV